MVRVLLEVHPLQLVLLQVEQVHVHHLLPHQVDLDTEVLSLPLYAFPLAPILVIGHFLRYVIFVQQLLELRYPQVGEQEERELFLPIQVLQLDVDDLLLLDFRRLVDLVDLILHHLADLQLLLVPHHRDLSVLVPHQQEANHLRAHLHNPLQSVERRGVKLLRIAEHQKYRLRFLLILEVLLENELHVRRNRLSLFLIRL